MKEPIPKEELYPFAYYIGKGRNADVAQWEPLLDVFITVGQKWGHYTTYMEPYGCFRPYTLIKETAKEHVKEWYEEKKKEIAKGG